MQFVWAIFVAIHAWGVEEPIVPTKIAACIDPALLERVGYPLPDAKIPWRTPELIDKIERGAPLGSVLLEVHPQGEGMTAALARVWNQPRFKQVPRIVLANQKEFRVREERILAAAPQIWPSETGELYRVLNARRVHITGAVCTVCIAQAVKDLVRQFRHRPQQRKLHLVIHTHAVVTRPPTWTLKEKLRRDGRKSLGEVFFRWGLGRKPIRKKNTYTFKMRHQTLIVEFLSY